MTESKKDKKPMAKKTQHAAADQQDQKDQQSTNQTLAASDPVVNTNLQAKNLTENLSENLRENRNATNLEATPTLPTESSARWTFLTNHSHVLILLHQDPKMVLREVAARIGITERAVQRIIADLEEEGFLQRQRVGRQNHYLIQTELSLRHPIESHCMIGQLLQMISQKPTNENPPNPS